MKSGWNCCIVLGKNTQENRVVVFWQDNVLVGMLLGKNFLLTSKLYVVKPVCYVAVSWQTGCTRLNKRFFKSHQNVIIKIESLRLKFNYTHHNVKSVSDELHSFSSVLWTDRLSGRILLVLQSSTKALRPGYCLILKATTNPMQG